MDEITFDDQAFQQLLENADKQNEIHEDKIQEEGITCSMESGECENCGS